MLVRTGFNDVVHVCSAAVVGVIFSAAVVAQTSHELPQPPSPGAALQAAAKAAAREHPHDGAIDVLSDTQGVDFGPYLEKVKATVRGHWFSSIPSSAELLKGRSVVEFSILKDGKVASLKLVESAGAILDRPALASITSSDPFPPLPEAFRGKYLSLRFRYLYNPAKAEIGSTPPISEVMTQHAMLIQDAADSHPIRYPQRELQEKTEGVVRLVARIAPDGTVESVAAIEGDDALGSASSAAIRKWRFQPARKDGQAVSDQVMIRVMFQIDGTQIRFAIFPGASLVESTPKP